MVAVWFFIAPTDDEAGTGREQESFPIPTNATPPTEDARVMVSFAVDDESEMKGSYPKSPIADDEDSDKKGSFPVYPTFGVNANAHQFWRESDMKDPNFQKGFEFLPEEPEGMIATQGLVDNCLVYMICTCSSG